MKIFAKRLRDLREERTFPQKHVATYLNVSQRSYSRYETAENQPTLENLKKLANFFNVSADYLIGNTDFPDPPN